MSCVQIDEYMQTTSRRHLLWWSSKTCRCYRLHSAHVLCRQIGQWPIANQLVRGQIIFPPHGPNYAEQLYHSVILQYCARSQNLIWL